MNEYTSREFSQEEIEEARVGLLRHAANEHAQRWAMQCEQIRRRENNAPVNQQ